MDVAVSAYGEKDVFSKIPIYPALTKGVKPTQTVNSISAKVAEYVSGGFTPGTDLLFKFGINRRNIKSTKFDNLPSNKGRGRFFADVNKCKLGGGQAYTLIMEKM